VRVGIAPTKELEEVIVAADQGHDTMTDIQNAAWHLPQPSRLRCARPNNFLEHVHRGTISMDVEISPNYAKCVAAGSRDVLNDRLLGRPKVHVKVSQTNTTAVQGQR
jgi:hypothetical protein